MNKHQLLIIGVLPALMERALSHTVELVRCAEINSQSWEGRPNALITKPFEAWQEKPNRRAGFASARRQAKKRRAR